MTSQFRKRIIASLNDPALQSALDRNAERRILARMTAYASLSEDIESLRQRAHALRARVIENLEAYLEQFTSQAIANGMQVHQAADAAEASRIVVEIARSHGARLAAKSKTMVGEEIHINAALEAAGVRVVETDLGEYIVQLRGEPPAHIITPAVHLSRQEVGRTFQEKLGVPYTDDIATLTATARKLLRQDFLQADIGISGVNFGIAESGAICLLTNEGNGRMVTTLPGVHVALMGIERLVPAYRDLRVMLELLPRSATGQKLTVYTSLVRGPRRPDEQEGPLERHIVLVDNGRRRLREGGLREALYCIRCGACLNACPVFRELGGHAYQGVTGSSTAYPGPIGSVISPGLLGVSEFGNLARASSLCGACKEACPVDIDLPKLLLRLRAEGAHPGAGLPDSGKAGRAAALVPTGLRLGLRAFAWAASSPRRFQTAQRLAGIFSRVISPLSEQMRLPAVSGWGVRRDLKRPEIQPFHRQFAGIEQRPPEPASRGQSVQNGRQPAPLGERERQHAPEEAQSLPDRIERFDGELAALGARMVRCKPGQAAERIVEILSSQDIREVQGWAGEQLPAGLLEALTEAGIQVQQEPEPGIRAGLSGALAGIAETGTLVVPGGAGRPLSASLLPELHIAVLWAGDLCQDLEQALSLEGVQQANSLVLISGPSRTADIEMTLTIGVHGPGQLVVVCLEEEPGISPGRQKAGA